MRMSRLMARSAVLMVVIDVREIAAPVGAAISVSEIALWLR